MEPNYVRTLIATPIRQSYCFCARSHAQTTYAIRLGSLKSRTILDSLIEKYVNLHVSVSILVELLVNTIKHGR